MKATISKRAAAMILSVMMVLALTPALPRTTEAVHAAEAGPAIAVGPGILSQYANDASVTVRFGAYDWYLIGYDGSGHVTAGEGRITLFAKDIQRNCAFNWLKEDLNVYSGSSIDVFLNGEFFDEYFSPSEQGAVVPHHLEGGGVDYGTTGYQSALMKGDSKEADLWLLSVYEAAELGQTMCTPATNSNWWLRTPGNLDDRAAVVFGNGSVVRNGLTVDYNIGVRSALDIDLDTVALVSASAGGKPTGTGADALAPVGVNSDNVWKLTIKDAAHQGFKITSATATANGGLKVVYSGAVSGTNEYISAIVTDSSGAVKYYGKLASASGAGGASATVNYQGKWDPAQNDKLYIFNEQANEDGVTDYCSPLIEVDDAVLNGNGIWSGQGTANEPFMITTEARWNALADYVAEGNSTKGLYFKLGNDVSVSRSVGTDSRPFNGTFDGGGHTLTFSQTTDAKYCAPFRYVGTAAFKNLRTAGTITTSNEKASGMIGYASGAVSIKNCVSDMDIVATGSGGTHTGFVSEIGNGGHADIEGSAFTGTITGEQAGYSAGFIGWDPGETSTSTIVNCVYDGTISVRSNGSTFIRTTDAADNSYYMAPIGQGRDKGKQAYSIKGPDGVTVSGTNAKTYNVSGIVGYTKGIRYNGVFYAGKGETVSLVIKPEPSNSELIYGADAGTMTGSGTKYQIVMPEQNVVLALRRTKLANPANVRLEVESTESGLVEQRHRIYACWDVVDDADGYYVTPYQVIDGKEIALHDPYNIKTVEASARLAVTSWYVGGKDNGDGEYGFKIQAYGYGGVKSGVVRTSETASLRKLTVTGNVSGLTDNTMVVLTGSDIAACIEDVFLEQASAQFYKQDGEYYVKDGRGESYKVLCVAKKPAFEYSSLAEAKADSYFVPGQDSSGETISDSVTAYAILETDTCEGDLHKWVEGEVTARASFDEDGWIKYSCSSCGTSVDRKIPKVSKVKLSRTSYTFTGESFKPGLTVRDEENHELRSGEDYTIEYYDNVYAGTAKVRVTLTGKYYYRDKTLEFTIAPAKVKVPAAKTGLVYNGKKRTGVAAPGKGASITGNTAVKAGTYKARLTLDDSSNYCWSDGTTADKTVTWKIAKKPVKPTVTVAKSRTYSGKAQKPSVTVKDGSNRLTKDTAYTVKYSNNTKVGKATAKVTLKGNYSGSKTVSFKIVPKRAVIDKAAPGTKQIKVTMKTKVASTGGSTYQIKYRVKGSSKWKTVTTTSKTKTIKSLKTGKRYQIKVRAYKKVKGVTYYGKWSRVKTTKKVK